MAASRIVSRTLRYAEHPLVYHWDSHLRPVPEREVRPHRRSKITTPLEQPPWIETGEPDRPFHFSAHLQHLCADIAARCEDFRHVDVSRILFAFTSARHPRSHGLQARLTPLRFQDGELLRTMRGHTYQVQRFFRDGHEILYIITFCLPRFLDRDFDDKFVTIFHELYHISPFFNGDLRRHAGRYAVHTSSQKCYDQEMAAMAREYLAQGADPKLHGFLRLNFAQLRHRHRQVIGHVVPRPKLLPVRKKLPWVG